MQSTPSSAGVPGSRWSTQKFTNLLVPSYIPPEALVHEDGLFLKAVLLRILSLDITRLVESKQCGLYFQWQDITPEYDSNGERTNTPELLLQQKRSKVLDDIVAMLKRHMDAVEAAAAAPKEIVRKRYFTAAEMNTAAYGAILGARGAVHQDLEKSTKCKIVLAGRGITNPVKDSNPNAALVAMEEPHVRVTAPTEAALQEAMQRIEWILSDEPDAFEFRERNRRRTAQVEGKYNPDTWVSATRREPGEPGATAGGKRPRDDAGVDEELEDFFCAIEQNATE